MKFIYKIILKKLKESFASRNNLTLWDKNLNDLFYQHYFQDLCSSLKMPMSEFYDPLNSSQSRKKTLNNKYLKLILRSDKFRKDSLSFCLSGELEETYQQSLSRKFDQITKKFNHLVNEEEQKKIQNTLEKIRKYFRYNRQCKLPWTFEEIKQAINIYRSICGSSSQNEKITQ